MSFKLRSRRHARIDRDPESIDTSDMAYPKPQDVRPREHVRPSAFWRSAAYRSFVRSRGCQIRGTCNHECGPRIDGRLLVDCAHIEAGALGEKASDDRSIGLCRAAHMLQHAIGWQRFEERFEIDRFEIADRLRAEWDRRKAR